MKVNVKFNVLCIWPPKFEGRGYVLTSKDDLSSAKFLKTAFLKFYLVRSRKLCLICQVITNCGKVYYLSGQLLLLQIQSSLVPHTTSQCITVFSEPINLTLSVLCISESCVEIKINLNLYFHTFLWCFKGFYEGLQGHHKIFWSTAKKCENKNLS